MIQIKNPQYLFATKSVRVGLPLDLTWQKPSVMSKRLHQLFSFLQPDRAQHDDAMRRKLEQCFQDFNAVKLTFAESDDQQTVAE